MEHREYNGWWNYETWLVNLWLDNEQHTYRQRRAHAANLVKEGDQEQRDEMIAAHTSYLREWVEEDNPLADDASLYSDLMGASLSEVNWHEIAEHDIDDAIDEWRADHH